MTALRMVDAVTGVELWAESMGNKGFKQAKRYMEYVVAYIHSCTIFPCLSIGRHGYTTLHDKSTCAAGVKDSFSLASRPWPSIEDRGLVFQTFGFSDSMGGREQCALCIASSGSARPSVRD